MTEVRCTGHYPEAKVGMGREVDQQCIGCAKRAKVIHSDARPWMTVSTLVGKCPHREEKNETRD